PRPGRSSPRRSPPGDPDHLGDGGDAAEYLFDRGLPQGPHALLPRELVDVERAGLARDETPDLLAHRHHLEDPGAADVPGLPAVDASLAAFEAVGLELLRRHPEHGRLVRRRRVILHAELAVLAHEPLGQDADERARYQEVRD